MNRIPLDAVHQYAYCPRRCYLMYHDGQWAPNYYTEDGLLSHARVDSDSSMLVQGTQDDGDSEPSIMRSVDLDSETLCINAKLDVVEASGSVATPVEIKRGRVPANELRSWFSERIQLMVQGLLLREAGYICDEGIIYYGASKTRVNVPFDKELEDEACSAVSATHLTIDQSYPPEPLVDSPKCSGCSLSGICLPDETLLLNQSGSSLKSEQPVRRFFPARDDALPLYVQEQGASVGRVREGIVVKKRKDILAEVRLIDISQVVILGNVQITAQALHLLSESEIPVVHLSTGHWFYGITHGFGLRNAFTKKAQFEFVADHDSAIEFARSIVTAKARNQRTMLRRNGKIEPASNQSFQGYIHNVQNAVTSSEILGFEGIVAAEYFRQFGTMLRPETEFEEFAWDKRNRRPPKDPVNAMLSFGYAMLCKECTVALAAVGLDPHWGVFHSPRHGRPSLALDLMEEFRPLIVDSAVTSAVNKNLVDGSCFVHGSGSCSLNSKGRKAFIRAYEARLDQLITHPIFEYRCSWRRVITMQAQLLARHIRGEIDNYTGMVTR